MAAKKKLVHVGYLSVDAKGGTAYHDSVAVSPKFIQTTLDKSITGDPYTVVKVYIKVKQ